MSDDKKYVTFVTYGNNTDLYEIIMDLWPWVDVENTDTQEVQWDQLAS
jgi:hypothetical protein